jgi:hypothetical protein
VLSFDADLFEGSFNLFPFLLEHVELQNEIRLDSNRLFSNKLFVFVDPLPIISIMFPVGLFDFTSIFFDDLSL